MAGDSDQQEIVLGNKQLLSIFFIVVAMMGIAFTVGYMVGRGGGIGGAGTASAASRQPAVTLPPPSDSSPAKASDPAVLDRPAAAEQPKPAPPIADTTPAPAETTTHPAVSRTAPDTPASDAPAAPPSPGPAPGTGSYLQVAAMNRQDADHLVKVLRERGFAALLGESPKPGFFRVLVGPFKDTPSLADSKAKLKAAGFEPIVAR